MGWGEGGGPGRGRWCQNVLAFPTIFLTPNKTMLSFVYIWKEIHSCVLQSCWKLMELFFFFFLVKVLEDPSKNINCLKMFKVNIENQAY